MLLGDLYKSFVGGGKKTRRRRGGTKKIRKSKSSRKSYGKTSNIPPYFGFK